MIDAKHLDDIMGDEFSAQDFCFFKYDMSPFAFKVVSI